MDTKQPNGPYTFGERAKLLAALLKDGFNDKTDDFTRLMMCEQFIAAAERGTLLQYLCDQYPWWDNLPRMEIINATQKAMRDEGPKAPPEDPPPTPGETSLQ